MLHTYAHYLAMARRNGRAGLATYANGGQALVSDTIGMLRGSYCAGALVNVRWF